jgi:hypothetical protein
VVAASPRVGLVAEELDWSKHPEKTIWDKWTTEGGRCPYCVGMPDQEWLAMCDCWEAERVLIDEVRRPARPLAFPACLSRGFWRRTFRGGSPM